MHAAPYQALKSIIGSGSIQPKYLSYGIAGLDNIKERADGSSRIRVVATAKPYLTKGSKVCPRGE
jgi:hypothetical protein